MCDAANYRRLNAPFIPRNLFNCIILYDSEVGIIEFRKSNCRDNHCNNSFNSNNCDHRLSHKGACRYFYRSDNPSNNNRRRILDVHAAKKSIIIPLSNWFNDLDTLAACMIQYIRGFEKIMATRFVIIIVY